ncbi:DUF7697 family protein [Sphingomonas panni]
MLVASKPQGPRYLPVIGAEILFDPIDRPMMRRARRAALKALQRPDDEEEGDVDPVVQLEDLGDALSFALIVEGARDWRDVAIGRLDEMGDPILVDGEPVFDVLTFSRENLEMLLTDPVIFDAIDAVYVMPFAQRERAKTASPPRRMALGGGDAGGRYCQLSCSAGGDRPKRCEGCPYRTEEAETEIADGVWEVLTACERQLRVAGTGRPFALDYGAVMAVGTAMDADLGLLADVLPAAEAAIVSNLVGDDDAGDEIEEDE